MRTEAVISKDRGDTQAEAVFTENRVDMRTDAGSSVGREDRRTLTGFSDGSGNTRTGSGRPEHLESKQSTANTDARRAALSRELPAMEVRDLYFSYGHNMVLRGINLYIREGVITTILGANGCGKSTLFSLATRSLTPDRGKIFLYGRNIQQMNLKEFARKVAIVNQYNTVSGDIRAEQLVAYGRTPFHRMMEENSEEDDRIIRWAMEVTGITTYRDREVGRLSGGQRQRVWIAMALAQNTKILFLDEPTTYLDIRYQIEILELIRTLNRRYGLTIVMVLHDINQAIYYSDRIIGLADGKVLLEGTPDEVIDRESIRRLYGVSLRVADVGGERVVLPAGRTDDNSSEEAHEDNKTRGRKDGSSGDDHRDSDGGNYKETSGGNISAKKGRKAEINGNDIINKSSETPNSGHDTLCTYTDGTSEDPASGARLSRFHAARPLWIALGAICLALGTVGIALPILPTVPFYLAAFFCFAKGSERLYRWFINTDLYHKYLESYVRHKRMTWKAKIRIMLTVTVVMALGFFMMKRVPVGRIILMCVWIAHIIVFTFVIKTEPAEAIYDADSEEAD